MRHQLRAWWKEERTKWSALSWPQRAGYVWDYYRLWILGAVCAVSLLAYGITHFLYGQRENWFYVCFANTYAEIGSGSAFWSDYARYAGYNLDEKNLVFDARVYCDPTREDYGNQYYQFLIAAMDSGTLDAVVLEQDRLRAMGSAGRLMDLEDDRVHSLMETYGDRLIWCVPQEETYGKTEVPIGIDLSGSALVGEGRAYGEDAALGINALAPHPEQTEVFLRYLFEEAAP